MIIKNFKTKTNFKKIQDLNKKYPKYLSSLLNYINGTMASSQTGPKKVGQMTELIEKYKEETLEKDWSVETWKTWYLNEKVLSDGTTGEEAFQKAVDKNVELVCEAIKLLSQTEIEETVADYLGDLIFDKTYKGLMIEKFVAFEALKNTLGKDFDENELIKSNASEESKNIDFIYKGIKIQVKPISFKARNQGVQLGNYIDLLLIYYEIKNKDIHITFENQELLNKIIQ